MVGDAYDNFVVAKVLEDFENYKLTNEELIKHISTFRWSDIFREKIKEAPLKHLERILDILEGDEGAEVRFAHMLLRSLMKCDDLANDLKSRLLEIYSNARDKINRIGLIYDLLEFEDIAIERRGEFLNYIETNRKEYADYETEWYVNDEGLLSANRQRLFEDPPQHAGAFTKKWIYLYNLSLIKTTNYREMAIDVILNFRSTRSLDEFTNQVCERALNELVGRRDRVDYDEFYSHSYSMANRMIVENIYTGDRILDLGCGHSPYLTRDRLKIRF